MQAIESAAYTSVGRACGFAGLAVLCVMLGLSFEPALATRTGGVMCLGLAVVLMLYGYFAPFRPYKQTELWLILPENQRPPDAFAQQVIGNQLRETAMRFAIWAALAATAFLLASLTMSWIGIGGGRLS